MKPKPILTFGLDHFDGAGHEVIEKTSNATVLLSNVLIRVPYDLWIFDDLFQLRCERIGGQDHAKLKLHVQID